MSDSNIFNIGTGQAPFEGTIGTIFRGLLFAIILFVGFIYVNGVWMNKDGPSEGDERKNVPNFGAAIPAAMANLTRYGFLGLGFDDNYSGAPETPSSDTTADTGR